MASGASRPVASTPWPRRVIRIRRSSGRPEASATRSRVEFVPQSMAATADSDAMDPCYHAGPVTLPGNGGVPSGLVEADPAGRPLADRVVAPGQPPGQVGVEALDPLACPSHPARRPGAGVVGIDERVTRSAA